MTPAVQGIHHVTAIGGDAQANLDFCAGVLGLRFVKRTVNFDDPLTYHLYYGDQVGRPGTILTYFPWGAGAPRGRIGTGQVGVTGFAIPHGSMAYWVERLSGLGVSFEGPAPRFDENAIALADPDGVALELVEAPDARPGWSNGDVPIEHAIRGFHQATLSLEGVEPTARLLTETLGFHRVHASDGRFRFARGEGEPGTILDLLEEPGRGRGRMGAGVVHHIAFRAATDADQQALAERIEAAGVGVTPVMDRQYFRSVYFREPGGVLFEIATDAPGFLIDESASELGMGLRLPPWLERQRATIEAQVPVLTPPGTKTP